MPNYAKFKLSELGPSFSVSRIDSLRWNCDGLHLASSSTDKQVKVGQLDPTGTLRTVHTIPSLTAVKSIVWHPTEPGRFCVVGDDKSIDLWDVRASRPASRIATLGGNLNVSWSPDGKYLGVGNSSQMMDNLVVVDLAQSKWIKRVKYSYEVNEFSWTANSSHLLLTTGEGSVDVLSIDLDNPSQDMTLLDSYTAHTSNCFALGVDANYQRLAVGSADHTVSLWHLDDLICHHTVQFDSPVRYLGFSGSGEHVAVVPEGSAVHIVSSDAGEVLAKVDCGRPMSAMAWHPKLPLLALGAHPPAPDPRQPLAQFAPSFLRLLSFAEK